MGVGDETGINVTLLAASVLRLLRNPRGGAFAGFITGAPSLRRLFLHHVYAVGVDLRDVDLVLQRDGGEDGADGVADL